MFYILFRACFKIGEFDLICQIGMPLFARCDGRRSCAVSSTVSAFGDDPCPGTSKYLEVHYQCVEATEEGEKSQPTPKGELKKPLPKP